MGCSKLGCLKKLLVLIGGLIAYGAINSAPALASFDVACPPNMTALFDQGSDNRCSFGMGNAIVGPYSDDYDSAKQLFETLTQAKTTWVKEAATYNLIRVEIRKTQSDARDSYGFFDLDFNF